jgi:hypothetical protein
MRWLLGQTKAGPETLTRGCTSGCCLPADVNSLGMDAGPLWDVACLHVSGSYQLQYAAVRDHVETLSEWRPGLRMPLLAGQACCCAGS